MHQAIMEMLEPYKCSTPTDYKNALKEIVQQIILLGLSRQDFFNKAAFYGGTALRIGYGLHRFSEDMDFTLLTPDKGFRLEKYLKGVEQELLAYELQFFAERVEKRAGTPIDSAFMKGNALSILLSIREWGFSASGTHKNELLKIKLEIDTDPPFFIAMKSELLFLTSPIPFSYRILDLELLFAGKLHAILCRNFPSGRVKGRDFYDFIWYVKSGISPDIPYLEAKLKQSGIIENNQILSLDSVKDMLAAKIAVTDFQSARKDVLPFIKDDFELELWSADFFRSLINGIGSELS